VRAIKRGRPDAHVTVVAAGALSEFWKGIAEVDDVIAFSPAETASAVAKKIALAGRFEAGILLPETRRGAVEMFMAGVPYRIGAPRRFLLNHWGNPPGESDPEARGAERYRRIAKAAGAAM
jgi:ADP-heptose:LPS heptosyltransferase